MTDDTTLKDEAHDATASLDDPIESKENKSSKEARKGDDSDSITREDMKSSNANDAIGENDTAVDPPTANPPTTGEGSTEQIPGEALILSTALSSLKAKKKAQKQIEPSNMIKTPNVHDVLLGRGKPVSCVLFLLPLEKNMELNSLCYLRL